MSAQDELSVPRRPLDIEDYIDIVRRHKAWIFGPLFAGIVISVVVAFLWQDTYVSSAVIRVVPPQVPANFVPSNITTDMQGRVNSMAQTILSRATLTNIINSQGLYPKERARLPLDDIVETMRARDVKIGAVQLSLNSSPDRQQYPAFQVSFQYNNRYIAQKVVTELVARFLEENQREISAETTSTTSFLKDEWQAAKNRLDQVEQKLSVFRTNNMGRLPEEQATNFAQLNAAQGQLLNLSNAMSNVNQQKLVLENQLRIYKDRLSTLKDPNAQEVAAQQQMNPKLMEKDREIAALENMLTQLREHYKDTYPDIQAVITRIATAKKQREEILKEDAAERAEEAKNPQAAPPASAQFAREMRDLDDSMRRLQAEIQAKDLEMDNLQKQAAQIQNNIKVLNSRLESTPVGIREYDQLMRERELARQDYERLDRQLESSESSTKLINRQQGERLEQLDPPSLPSSPSQPKRPQIIAIGAALGLILGVLLAGAREVKDTSLKNLKDVRAYTQLPILGSIPLLENDLVVRRRKRLAWLAWSTACLIGVVIMSSSVVYYYATKI